MLFNIYFYKLSMQQTSKIIFINDYKKVMALIIKMIILYNQINVSNNNNNNSSNESMNLNKLMNNSETNKQKFTIKN